MIGAGVGFRYSFPFGTCLITGMTIVGIAGSTAIVARLAILARQREEHPTKRLIADLPMFSSFAAGVMLIALQLAVLNWAKVMLPVAVPFWADPLLANIDQAVFGQDPWRLAHAAFGWAAPFIDRVYISWAIVKFVTLLLLLARPESVDKARALMAYFIIMACGALGEYLLSSGGPIFYGQLGFGDRFSQLPAESWVQSAAAYLWHDYLIAGGDVGTGISAMPSLHVAIALWVALVIRSFVPKAAFVGFAYFALILLGSVLLGWHYAVDGIVAIGIAKFAWTVAPRLVRGRAGVPFRDAAGMAVPNRSPWTI